MPSRSSADLSISDSILLIIPLHPSEYTVGAHTCTHTPHTLMHTLMHTTSHAPSPTMVMLPDSLTEVTDQRLFIPSNSLPVLVRLDNVKTSWGLSPFLVLTAFCFCSCVLLCRCSTCHEHLADHQPCKVACRRRGGRAWCGEKRPGLG